MRLLLDENIPATSFEILRNGGHEVVSASSFAGESDRSLLKKAEAEGRVVLTFDRDFGFLVFKDKAAIPLGVVLLRFIPESPEEPAAVLEMLLEHPSIELPGKFITVTRERIRQRDLPSEKA